MVLIDVVVVLGAGAVVPAALRRWTGAWVAVAAATALALSVDPGAAGLVLALPWAAVALAATAVAVRDVVRAGPIGAERPRWARLDDLAAVAAPGFLVVAGVALVDSCGGLGLVPTGEPITRLTAVHFAFAGTATTALAGVARQRARGRTARRVATAGLALALVAPPVVALGFLSGTAVPQVGGAVLMSAGAYLVAGRHLAEAWPARSTPSGRLLALSGLSIWIPMVLAVAWALGQHTGGPALSIPDMARIHGSLNAFGFVGCGLAARWLADHTPAPGAAVDGRRAEAVAT